MAAQPTTPAASHLNQEAPANAPIASARTARRPYATTIDAAAGSIIAVIITNQLTPNQPTLPKSVAGPASMPAIRFAVKTHAAAAAASTTAVSPRSVGPDRRSAVTGQPASSGYSSLRRTLN